MKTAITLSLLPSRPSMPFVLGPDLDEGFALAAELGFDAIEIFPPSMDALDRPKIAKLSQQHSIPVSTIGTGGGAVSQGLTLTDADADIRKQATAYIRNIIEAAGDLGGSAIIGSMQGRAGAGDRDESLKWLGDALAELGDYAKQWNQPLLFEPLNRYESDLVNRLEQAVTLIESHQATNAKVLADLFHMNIEEVSIAQALTESAQHIGHVHFVDSNRWPAGCGHSDLKSAYEALKADGFQGFLAVEAFPLPNQRAAAENAAQYFQKLLN